MKYPLPTIARSVGRPVASVVAKVEESAATAKSPATQHRNTARFAKKCRPTRIIHDFISHYATGDFKLQLRPECGTIASRRCPSSLPSDCEKSLKIAVFCGGMLIA